jgi:hypothetical protein
MDCKQILQQGINTYLNFEDSRQINWERELFHPTVGTIALFLSTTSHPLELQGEHLLAKVFAEIFSVTKFGKNFKKAFATTSSIGCRGFNRCSI